MPVPAPSSAEELTVDVSHSFYFDHPLDHVPGIALVNALYELASGAERNVRDAPRADRMQSRLRFTRFCETDRKTWLSCTADGPGAQSGERRWNVVAEQEDNVVCEGVVCFTSAPADGDRAGPPVREREPSRTSRIRPREQSAAPARLVHRRWPENILVGVPMRSGDIVEAAVLTPPQGHVLRAAGSRLRTPAEVIEAGRQLCTMMEHLELGQDMDTQLIWASLSMDLPVRMLHDLDLTLRSAVPTLRNGMSHFRMTVLETGSGLPIGSLTFAILAASPERYAQLRFR